MRKVRKLGLFILTLLMVSSFAGLRPAKAMETTDALDTDAGVRILFGWGGFPHPPVYFLKNRT